MAFGIGINNQAGQEGAIKGKQEMVACDCWFSSTGNTMPRLVKYKDSMGNINCISNIQVKECAKKRFCGIPFMEYRCSTIAENQAYEFTLLFHMEDCRWKIIWNKTE